MNNNDNPMTNKPDISEVTQGQAYAGNETQQQDNSASIYLQQDSDTSNPAKQPDDPTASAQQYNDAPSSTQADISTPIYPKTDHSAPVYPQTDHSAPVYPQTDHSAPVYPQTDNITAAYTQSNEMYAKEPPAAPLLQLNDLCKRYPGMGSYMSVFHMNLIIPRGRIIGLLGPNGCGKSTLIKMINGLLTPTSGNVLINGLTPCATTKKIISYLPERTYLDNGMKVSQMVSYFADFYEDFSTEKAFQMLNALGINTEARLKTLSKGTKEKVQLILVMSRQADLYILDEPIAGVDPAARDYILRTIITNYNPGSTIILSTHLISDIENILDDVIFMKNGSLMLYTSVESIRSQMGKSVDTYFREVYAC